MHFGNTHHNNNNHYQDTATLSHFSHRISQPLFARHARPTTAIDNPSSSPPNTTEYALCNITTFGTTILNPNRNDIPEMMNQRRSSRRHIRPHGQARNNQDSMTQSAASSTTGLGATRDHVPKTSLGRGFKKMKSMLMIKSGPSYPNEPPTFETAANQPDYHQMRIQTYYQAAQSSSSSRHFQRAPTPDPATVLPGAYMLNQEMNLEDSIHYGERAPSPFPETPSWLPHLDLDPPFGGAAARAAAASANHRMKMERKDSNLTNPPLDRGYGRENRESGIIMSAEHSRVRDCRSRRESRVEGKSEYQVGFASVTPLTAP